MAIDILIFIYLALKYTYRDENEPDEESSNVPNTKEIISNQRSIPTINFTTANSRTSDKEHLDTSPKCLKQRAPTDKAGIDNYGYADI